MKKCEEKNALDNFVKERIGDNEEVFTKKELVKINEEFMSIKKIYLLGLINGREVYK